MAERTTLESALIFALQEVSAHFEQDHVEQASCQAQYPSNPACSMTWNPMAFCGLCDVCRRKRLSRLVNATLTQANA